MKICFFGSDFPPMVGGISRATWSLADSMSHNKTVEHVQVVALKNPQRGEGQVSAKFSVIRDSTRKPFGIFLKVLKYSWRFRKYDVFHATNIFPVGFFVLLIGKYIFRKPVIVSFYGADVLWEHASSKTKKALRFTLKHASIALAFSHSTKKLAAKHYDMDPRHFDVAYYPFCVEEPTQKQKDAVSKIRHEIGITPEDKVLLFVGNIFKYKGGEYLIRAVSGIKDEHVKLIFIGTGPDEEYFKTLTKELGIQNRVIFAGKVSDTIPYYLLAHMFSMPSYFDPETGDTEGLGIVYLEAAFYGLPVIGSNCGGIVEALQDGRNGFIVPEHDAGALKEKIEFFALNEDKRVHMGKQGREFVKERFGAEVSIQNYLDIYKKVL